MEPPIHTLYRRSTALAGHTTCAVGGRVGADVSGGAHTRIHSAIHSDSDLHRTFDVGHRGRQVSHLLLQHPTIPPTHMRTTAMTHTDGCFNAP